MSEQSKHWDRFLKLHGEHMSDHAKVLCDMLMSDGKPTPNVAYCIRSERGWLGNDPKASHNVTWVPKQRQARNYRSPGAAAQAYRYIPATDGLEVVLFMWVESGSHKPWDWKKG